jgi:hypothetical protein
MAPIRTSLLVRVRVALVLPATSALALLACVRSNGTSSSGDAGASTANTATAKPPSSAACAPSALGLGTAAPVQLYRVPIGCALGGSGGPPATIRSEEEFHAALNCQKPSGIDFKANELVASARMLPPAGMGTDVVDDGKTVTFVNKQRRPCPNEPPPMPITVTVGFLLPAGATRSYADKVCTVDTQCP